MCVSVRSDTATGQVEHSKNAYEAGSSADTTELGIEVRGNRLVVRVSDRGTGISTQVAANALLPFYSTKQTGSGLAHNTVAISLSVYKFACSRM